MDENEFESCVCRIAVLLYRCDEPALARAERELHRLADLAAHYRAVANGATPPGDRDSAAHLCRALPAGRHHPDAPSPPPRRHRGPPR